MHQTKATNPRNKFNLSIESMPKHSRKYLGEAQDPHYVPTSPLIERQVFTPQEERELKRICTLVLSQVPHTDDMVVDPTKFVSTQIRARTALAELKLQAANQGPSIQYNNSSIHHYREVDIETATPSEASRPDTMYRSDVSTPMTSAGVTPAESSKRFSDAVKQYYARRSESVQKGTSHTNSMRSATRSITEENPRKSSDLVATKSLEHRRSMKEMNSTKSTSQSAQRSSQPRRKSQPQPEMASCPPRISRVELNQNMPHPPAQLSKTSTVREQPIYSPRVMDSIQRKKNQTMEVKPNNYQSNSMAAPLSLKSARSQPSLRPRSAHATQTLPHTMQQVPVVPSKPAYIQTASTPEPKRKFNFRFFSKRNRATDMLVV